MSLASVASDPHESGLWLSLCLTVLNQSEALAELGKRHLACHAAVAELGLAGTAPAQSQQTQVSQELSSGKAEVRGTILSKVRSVRSFVILILAPGFSRNSAVDHRQALDLPAQVLPARIM